MSSHEKPGPVSDSSLVTKELNEWERHLNEIVGIMCFTLAMASVGTPTPQLWSMLSIVFVLLFQRGASKGKMELLTQLRNKKNRTNYEEFLLNEITSSLKPIKFMVFIIGFVLLVAIASAPIFSAIFSVLFGVDQSWLKFIYGNAHYTIFNV
ncbi:hypothetical protein D9M68_845490 [compost metagenome]